MSHSYSRLVRHSGNQNFFRVIKLSVAALVNDRPFHIQTEGSRGTGKTTILQAVRELLPPITRIKNCLYNCHPVVHHCPLHRHLSQAAIVTLGKRFKVGTFWAAVKTRAVALLKIRGCVTNYIDKEFLGEQGTARIVDPLNTTITAPPKPAVPLVQLPDAQLVTRSPISHG